MKTTILTLALLSAAVALTAAPKDVTGHWRITLEGEKPTTLVLLEDADGHLTGVYENGTEGCNVTGLHVNTLVNFSFRCKDFDTFLYGTLTNDGKIAGAASTYDAWSKRHDWIFTLDRRD